MHAQGTKINHETDLAELRRRLRELSYLQSTAAILHWDQSTLMPDEGASFRGDQLAYLEKITHEKSIDPALGALLQRLSQQTLSDQNASALVRVAKEDFNRNARLPSEFVERLTTHSVSTYQIWKRARAEKNFQLVIEPLKKSLELSQEYSSFFSGFNHIADPLIDAADPGLTVAQTRPLFAELRKGLLPLIDEVLAHGETDSSCLSQDFDEDKQLAFATDVIRQIGYEFTRGRQDKSPHPFMIRINSGDVRITTRVRRNDLGDALFSCIHEAGHALYELGIDPELEFTPLARGVSAALHESQSRLWENLVGRSLPFWEYFYPRLQEVFPAQLSGVSLKQFVCAINKVQRSLIRTDADELTYNLHVMIRFDLEIDLLEGRLKVEDLRDAWNERYRLDLKMTPPDDGDGVLQDVHWYSGLIGGAFQGYTVGNVISGQLFAAAERDLGDLSKRTRHGDFATLRNWLRSHVHRFGRVHTVDEILLSATGQSLSTQPYMSYLQTKYRGLKSL